MIEEEADEEEEDMRGNGTHTNGLRPDSTGEMLGSPAANDEEDEEEDVVVEEEEEEEAPTTQEEETIDRRPNGRYVLIVE